MDKIISKEMIRNKDGILKYRIKYLGEHGVVCVDKEIPSRNQFFSNKSDLMKSILLWILMGAFVALLMRFFGPDLDIVGAEKLKGDIVLSVQNGADLDVVKRVYENRAKIQRDFSNIFESEIGSYRYDVPLSIVLEDIRSELYLGSERPDADLVEKINALIASHNQENPFDKLTKQQKDYFESVRQNAADIYPIIQNDMNNISDELYLQNQMVDSYLSDSKTSFYVSIVSLLFALVVSAYQIYQGSSKKFSESLKVVLDEIFAQSELEAQTMKKEQGSKSDALSDDK